MEHVVSFRRLDMLKGTPQPFPYQGSKRYLANAIVPLIPDGVDRIIEPFCGSAAVSIAARQTGKVQSAVIADINAPLIDLWNEILKEPDRLIVGYTYLWNEQLSNPREYFKEVRDSFNETHKTALLI
ncbi:DNA adenine methylase [uncultured Bifidobacterium sp.]|uniref:DNA adenine methylase n=1 Tax=uncultured Bifidobacterium sp. TaxID=165187 RepID=UPI002597C0DF|nr:DNA adenine methylase [uncultured Bifidobacterium sp.]